MHLILHESNKCYESFLSHYILLLLLISLVYLLPNGQWLFRVLLLIDPKLPALMMLLLWLLLRPDELARRRKSFSVGDVSTELGTANTSRLVGLVCRFSVRFIIIINENRQKNINRHHYSPIIGTWSYRDRWRVDARKNDVFILAGAASCMALDPPAVTWRQTECSLMHFFSAAYHWLASVRVAERNVYSSACPSSMQLSTKSNSPRCFTLVSRVTSILRRGWTLCCCDSSSQTSSRNACSRAYPSSGRVAGPRAWTLSRPEQAAVSMWSGWTAKRQQ